MKPLARSFTALLPIAAVTFSFVLLFGITAANFHSYKHAALGSDTIYIGTTTTGMATHSHNFLPFALTSAELWTQNPITILNAPAHFVNLPITYVMSRGPF